MWNARRHQRNACCSCGGCCNGNSLNRTTAFQHSLYVSSTPWNRGCSQPQRYSQYDCCGGQQTQHDCCCEEEHPDLGSLLDNVPSSAQAAKCIEKLQHLVLVKVKDPATSVRCLQELFLLKKILVEDCVKNRKEKRQSLSDEGKQEKSDPDAAAVKDKRKARRSSQGSTTSDTEKYSPRNSLESASPNESEKGARRFSNDSQKSYDSADEYEELDDTADPRRRSIDDEDTEAFSDQETNAGPSIHPPPGVPFNNKRR